MVKNPPAMQEIRIRSLGQEYPLEKGVVYPLFYSCLENPRDGGAWWAAVYGVAQSRTRLKRLSSSSSRHHIKKQRHYFANKGLYSQSSGFSSGHVWVWELDYKEN